ncbi:transporter [Heyndrickxia sporothermodurans]|uniref:Transporter n=1 Tax=Heyndrickxia sporothermodurans TaxID=46224 RepID=A0AB37HIY0_9BACI|nr:transporter [Heyndrickxia sporothermodurans]MBL5767160.1 transporter [Heyndrickxia sporothermodurans]MBL5770659.1 transporter [Heyndrickxia sporothermodurans]MBL5775210.1 transporter [Heyndrickxia sporothermodurans]MBL5779218.1 transporter [Heyndrickxia sporothermodurans]MBL5783509.1 transporter [Heyndrickxia sporothermodurans]
MLKPFQGSGNNQVFPFGNATGQGQWHPTGPPPGQGQGPSPGQGQGQGFPPGLPPGQGQGQGFPPGPPPGQGQGQGFPPGPPPGQGQGFPPGPPPGAGQGTQSGSHSSSPSVYAVDPGAFKGCLHRYTRVRLRNGQRFWFYPTFIGRTSVAGYRWINNRWRYEGMDTNRIVSFNCS